MMTYIKENIVTKLQKSLTLFVKKPVSTGDLFSACKIFMVLVALNLELTVIL